MDCSPPGISVHGDSLGKNIRNCHALLHVIFPTQGSNPGLPQCRRILYHLSCQGSLRILEWVAYPFSRGSSYPGIEQGSPTLQADSLPAELPGKPLIVMIEDLFSGVVSTELGPSLEPQTHRGRKTTWTSLCSLGEL